jgi:hypothetical protein
MYKSEYRKIKKKKEIKEKDYVEGTNVPLPHTLP